MEDCFDNKNIISNDYYVCTNCSRIIDYQYIYDNSYYENESNLNKNFISKSYYKRMNYSNKNYIGLLIELL